MSPNSMDAGQWTLACTAAKLRLMPAPAPTIANADSAESHEAIGSLPQFHRSFGDHWVHGQVVLSARGRVPPA